MDIEPSDAWYRRPEWEVDLLASGLREELRQAGALKDAPKDPWEGVDPATLEGLDELE